MLATRVKFSTQVGDSLGFNVGYKRELFWVNSFEDGFVTVEPGAGWNIVYFAEVIEGCFSPNSNLKEEVCKAFKLDINTPIRGIKCVFNDKHICTATHEMSDKEWIVSQWRNAFHDR